MKIFLTSIATLLLLVGLLLVGCSTKNPPTTDISNAKMALVKAESTDAKIYAADDLVRIKVKYQTLQHLMQEEDFEAAKFLSQEIQADARLLEKKSERVMMERRVKKLEGEINTINKDFTEVRE